MAAWVAGRRLVSGKGRVQTVGPIGEVEFSIQAAGNSGGGFGEELVFRFFKKRTIAQGLEKGEEFIDFLFTLQLH